MHKNFKKIILSSILLAVFGLGFFAFSASAQAATRYVDDDAAENGSRTCTNTGDDQCKTIAYAITKASAGDTIIVAAGSYNESFTVNKSITVQGTLDANGNRLSIIDPYTNISGTIGSNWTHAGNGVYSKNIGYKTWAMAVEIGGVRYKIPLHCKTEDSGNCSDWLTDLNRDTSRTYPIYENGIKVAYVNMWDGFNALFASGSDDNKVYVSFYDDSVVSDKSIFVATSGDSAVTVNANNVTIKDLEIRVKKFGINIVASDNVRIDNNKLFLGRIKIQSDQESDNVTISNNIITDQNYADYVNEFTRGAHTGTTEISEYPYTQLIRLHLYRFGKYGLTDDNGYEESTAINILGDGATITANTISKMNDGVNTDYRTSGLEVANNTMSNLTSIGVGIDSWGDGGENLSIHDNLFLDVNISMRFQHWDGCNPWANPIVYTNCSNSVNAKIYRNKIWGPPNLGEHIHFHYGGGPGVTGTIGQQGTAWIYHNSFSGGAKVVGVSGYAQYFTPRGMGQVYFVNNIMSSHYVYLDYSYGANPGGCWYNWLGHSLVGNGYIGQCNGTGTWNNGTTLMWDTTTLPDFIIPSPLGDNAINAGIDISQPFTIGATTYPALPGFSSGYFTGINPDMGAVQSGDANPADVDGSGSVNIKDIQTCVRVITGSNTTYENQCRALAEPTGSTNIKDIQIIMQAIIAL